MKRSCPRDRATRPELTRHVVFEAATRPTVNGHEDLREDSITGERVGLKVEQRLAVARIEGEDAVVEETGVQRDAVADREGLERRRALRDETLALRTLTDAQAQLALAERIRRSTLLNERP